MLTHNVKDLCKISCISVAGGMNGLKSLNSRVQIDVQIQERSRHLPFNLRTYLGCSNKKLPARLSQDARGANSTVAAMTRFLR